VSVCPCPSKLLNGFQDGPRILYGLYGHGLQSLTGPSVLEKYFVSLDSASSHAVRHRRGGAPLVAREPALSSSPPSNYLVLVISFKPPRSSSHVS
jgi:hypothetical protein